MSNAEMALVDATIGGGRAANRRDAPLPRSAASDRSEPDPHSPKAVRFDSHCVRCERAGRQNRVATRLGFGSDFPSSGRNAAGFVANVQQGFGKGSPRTLRLLPGANTLLVSTAGSRSAAAVFQDSNGGGGPDGLDNPGSSNLDWRSKMKLKSLLFGSAAVLAAGTGALAADLPMVEPVEYVRICDAFGAGFYYIPGTDTCLKIGGYVRAESHYVDGDGAERYQVLEADVNNWTTRARGQVNLDARTQTDFGLVRAYIALEMTVGPGNTTTSGPNANPNYDNTNSNLAAAFIQISNNWGTYTAGHTGSFFDFWGGNSWGTRVGIEAGTGEATLFAWTFAGGNGFSLTLSAEDPSSIGRRRNGDDDYEGQEAPDGVANIRVDQGWGSAQIMGAIRHVHDFNGAAIDDAIGFAVGAGLSLNLPGGWTFSSQGGYSEGAISYISADPGGIGDLDQGPADDLNESWAVRAGLAGPLGANWRAWVEGAFVHAEEDDGFDEYDFWAFAVGASWSPVSGLIMGPEFAYNSYDFSCPPGGCGGGAADNRNDYDIWGVMWRVQRSF